MRYILDNYDKFVELGFLMRKELASINIADVLDKLRSHHMQDAVISKMFSFSDLVSSLLKNIQRARYENFLFKLASAYEGYKFDLPAFLDFRGRIYRSGVLHFHERDLARSLILFAGKVPTEAVRGEEWCAAFISASFHHHAHRTLVAASDWISSVYNSNKAYEEYYFESIAARGAKRPFQFLSTIIGLVGGGNPWERIPITHDASASAYQIVSYLLLDSDMAGKTNLIPNPEGEIKDIYEHMLVDLKDFILSEMGENSLTTTVCTHLTRKLVKDIFMPLIYGKTLMKT